jgi:ZIP family zinc transporter
MKASGRGARHVFLIWGMVALVSTVAALLGFLLLQGAPVELVAVITTIAAGAILAMVCNTMIPEAFAEDRVLTGLWATLGFLASFTLSHLG